MKSECEYLLQELTGKNYIIFTRRGNSSISNVLEIFKEIGYDNVLIQDQGGWMTYEKYAEEHKLKCMMLKTKYGLVNPLDLELHHDSVLLINSMAAYSFMQDMKTIEICSEPHAIKIINDVSGSIGTFEAKIGDVIIGSFGRWKPINMGEGGFIATSDEKIYSLLSQKIAYNPTQNFFKELEIKLKDLPNRINKFEKIRKQTIEKLEKEKFKVIFSDSQGINIIVKFHDEIEKKRILDFCKKEELEYTECPRYIRVNENAISIEIKRIDF